MKARFSQVLGTASALAAIAPLSKASADLFLKLDGIVGESLDKVHKDEIQVQSFSLGVSNTGSTQVGGGAGAGRANFQDMSLSATLYKASPALANSSPSRQRQTKPTLTFRTPGATSVAAEVYSVVLENVVVTSVSTAGNADETRPNETYSLNYGSIVWKYTPTLSNGSPGTSVTAGWNITQNKKI
jgi:type VI secretion system secreted protein Hcp